jgi:hypothetical protein
MARKTTKTTAIDLNMVAIADFCQNQGINEQIFRLELMQFMDNADSTKICDFDVANQILSNIQATSKALPEAIETTENLTPTGLEPSQETAAEQPQKPQNSSIVGNAPKSISASATGQSIPTALSEFIAKSQEDIELFDLVQVYRNEQIIQNTQTRDSELAAALREQRLESRAMVFDQLRELNSRQPIPQELPELPSALSDEIKSLADELGKKLAA